MIKNDFGANFVPFPATPPLNINVHRVTSLSDLLYFVKLLLNDPNIISVYCRGQGNSHWNLIPTFGRDYTPYKNKIREDKTILISDYLDGFRDKEGNKIYYQKHPFQIVHPLGSDYDHAKDPHLETALANLRQRGLPSPLLDWTENIYIALYMILDDLIHYKKMGSTLKPAIYMMIQYKSINYFGPDALKLHHRFFANVDPIKAEKSHIKQASHYSYLFIQRGLETFFYIGPYEEAEVLRNNNLECWKIIIENIDLDEVKDMLAANNINKETVY